MFSKRNILALILGGLFYSSLAQPASAVASTVVVTPGDMATSFADVIATPTKWFLYNDETDAIDNSLGSFVSGPAGVPFGTESIQIGVSGTQRRNLATYQFSGTPLGDITELSFYTYNPSAGNPGSVSRSGYLNFNVDFNGTDTWQRRLVFVPSMNGTVTQNMWQKWDALQSGTAQSVSYTHLVPHVMTWADTDRDLTAWVGNKMQQDAIQAIYALEKDILKSKDEKLISDWRHMLTSDHFYYMCTKWFADGDVHAYFSPYESPYEAFIAFMNALKDVQWRVHAHKTRISRKRKAR